MRGDEPPLYQLSISHSFAREDEFLPTRKSKPLEGDRNEMGPPLPIQSFHAYHSKSGIYTPLSGNPNHSEETTTRWVSPLTKPFHYDGKSKPIEVKHLLRWEIQTIRSRTPLLCYRKSKILGEPQRDGSHPLLGLSTQMENSNRLGSDTSSPLSGIQTTRRTTTRWVSPPTLPFHYDGKS